MTEFFAICLAVSPRWRRCALCIVVLVVMALPAFVCLQSYRDLCRLQWDEYPSLVSRYRQQRGLLQLQPVLPQLIVRNQQLREEVQKATGPFSLPALLAETGAVLEKWQPESSHTYLSLTLGWKGVQQLFAYFAQKQSSMRVEQFTLQQSDSQLKAIFILQESNDEQERF